MLDDSEHDRLEPLPDPANPAGDEFYVGYLPVPPGQRRFVLAFVSMLFVWCLCMCCIIVVTMRDPGVARFGSGEMQSWSGTLLETPYPMLVNEGEKNPTPFFVVSMGKHGAQARLKPYFGRHVTISGSELNRQGRRLIELSEETDAIVAHVPGASQPPVNPEIAGRTPAALHGEIVDGKCYLGAMKPADGFAHRACAVLCLSNGLPPMFVARTPEGDLLYYLLLVDGSTTLSQEMLGLVGRPVEIRGETGHMLGTPVILATASGITPSP